MLDCCTRAGNFRGLLADIEENRLYPVDQAPTHLGRTIKAFTQRWALSGTAQRPVVVTISFDCDSGAMTVTVDGKASNPAVVHTAFAGKRVRPFVSIGHIDAVVEIRDVVADGSVTAENSVIAAATGRADVTSARSGVAVSFN